MEGAHQRSGSGRQLSREQGPAAGAQAPARRQQSGIAHRLGVSRHPDPAVHRRPDVVGGHRRPDDGEPGAPRAGVGLVDAGGVQEQHRRQRAAGDRRRDGRRVGALVSGRHEAGGVGDLPHHGQRHLPRDPAGRVTQRPELRGRARGGGVRPAVGEGPAPDADGGLLARQQPEGPSAPARGGRRRSASRWPRVRGRCSA